MPVVEKGRTKTGHLRLIAADEEVPDTGPMQRSQGEVRISFKASGGRTRLDGLYQQGCMKARLPKQAGLDQEAILINTAGGLTGGDGLKVNVEWGAETGAAVTTQACERIYKSTGPSARVMSSLTVGPGAVARWLPQETIIFQEGRLDRRMHVSLAESATLIACEAVIVGRPAMGEYVHMAGLSDEWVIESNGRTRFIDRMKFAGDFSAMLDKAAVGNGSRAFASIITAGAETGHHCDLARAAIDAHDVTGGSSDLDGICLTRIIAPSGHDLRKVVIPILSSMCGRELPRVWTL